MPIVGYRMSLVDKVIHLNQINPKGFRAPGRHSYSLAEKLLIRDGVLKPEPLPRERESRGERFDLELRRVHRRKMRAIAMEQHRKERELREELRNRALKAFETTWL